MHVMPEATINLHNTRLPYLTLTIPTMQYVVSPESVSHTVTNAGELLFFCVFFKSAISSI